MDERWKSAAEYALKGAGYGASVGSLIPVVGTGIGAAGGTVLGGLYGYFGGGDSEFLNGRPDKFSEVSNQTPEQQQLLAQILAQLGPQSATGQNYEAAQNYLGQLLSRDPSVYDRFAAPYMQQFEQQTIPRLAERFGALGGGMGGGVAGSSGFGQAIGGAASNYQSQLANMFANLQNNAAQQATGQYNNLTSQGLSTQAFQPTYQPGNTGLLGGLASGVAQGAGPVIGKNMMEQLFSYLNSNKQSGIPTAASEATSLGPKP
jgi:hypothetical protein